MNNFNNQSRGSAQEVYFPELTEFSHEFNPHPAQSQVQYTITVKRNDNLYKTLSLMNTLFSIISVLLIIAVFGLVVYSLVTITEVAEVVSQIKEHNAIVPAGTSVTPVASNP